jgi:hypothetical protein
MENWNCQGEGGQIPPLTYAMSTFKPTSEQTTQLFNLGNEQTLSSSAFPRLLLPTL